MEKQTNLTFGEAIAAMKQGDRVQRSGWNGKNMHIYLEEHFHVILGQGGMRHQRKYNPFLILFNAQGEHQPGWNPSTPDVLAEDWQIVQ